MSTEDKLKKLIFEWSKYELTDNVAEHLSVYFGALQAIQSNGGKTTSESLKAALEVISVGDKDFLDLARSKNYESVLLVLGELMESLKVINNRVYESVMLQLSKI